MAEEEVKVAEEVAEETKEETPAAEEAKEEAPAVEGKMAEFIDYIEGISVLELSKLVKALEDRLGVSAAAPVAVAAIPATTESAKKESDASGAVTYGNENIAFFLIDQGNKLVAYVVRSSSENYAQGEKIGTFEKSSLPNVYRVEWKDMDKDIEQTTGYFDEQGNLKIDVKRNGKVEVLTFVKE